MRPGVAREQLEALRERFCTLTVSASDYTNLAIGECASTLFDTEQGHTGAVGSAGCFCAKAPDCRSRPLPSAKDDSSRRAEEVEECRCAQNRPCSGQPTKHAKASVVRLRLLTRAGAVGTWRERDEGATTVTGFGKLQARRKARSTVFESIGGFVELMSTGR